MKPTAAAEASSSAQSTSSSARRDARWRGSSFGAPRISAPPARRSGGPRTPAAPPRADQAPQEQPPPPRQQPGSHPLGDRPHVAEAPAAAVGRVLDHLLHVE